MTGKVCLFVPHPKFSKKLTNEFVSTEPQLKDLWNDILNAFDKFHYMSTIILFRREAKIETVAHSMLSLYEIVDGQQRICSIVLLMSALYDELVKEKQFKKAVSDSVFERFLFYTPKQSKQPCCKLELFGGLNDVLVSVLENKPLEENSINHVASRILAAKQFFTTQLNIKKQEHENNGGYIAFLKKFLNTMQNSLYLTIINAKQHIDVYKYFELTNSRGKSISIAETIKNYLHFLNFMKQLQYESMINDTWSLMYSMLHKFDMGSSAKETKLITTAIGLANCSFERKYVFQCINHI